MANGFNGWPQVHVPQSSVPYVSGALAIIGTLVTVLPPHTMLWKVLTTVLAFAPAVAAASPGFNKSNQ